MSIRKFGAILGLIACASFLAVPVAASAQSTPTSESVSSFKSVPVSGKASNGRAFKNGHFSVQRFVTRPNGKTYAIGTLTGNVGLRHINRSNVAIPISVQHTGIATTAATCQILNLVLGPLHLNLLGLHIDLNQVVLNITGTTGNGQLLGNLLCGLANLLNGNSALSSQLGGLLNILNQLLGTPSLLGL